MYFMDYLQYKSTCTGWAQRLQCANIKVATDWINICSIWAWYKSNIRHISTANRASRFLTNPFEVTFTSQSLARTYRGVSHLLLCVVVFLRWIRQLYFSFFEQICCPKHAFYSSLNSNNGLMIKRWSIYVYSYSSWRFRCHENLLIVNKFS